jgi:hypothetical protein
MQTERQFRRPLGRMVFKDIEVGDGKGRAQP